MDKLIKKILQLESLAIIGMEKNVGKTTTLNFIINEAKGKHLMGLTSIGIDGEKEDQVTGNEKPTIYVHEGTLLATAKKSYLSSDITKEILATTGIQTPMGEVIIFRALSDGYVELMGPSINFYLKAVIVKLKQFGCNTVVIDGALNRSSTADPSIAEGVILATGAAIARDIKGVIDRTCHKLELLRINTEADKKRTSMLQEAFHKGKVSFIYGDRLEISKEPTALGGEGMIKEGLNAGANAVIISGVVGDRLIEYLLRHIESPEGKIIYVEDGTKLFISSENYHRLMKRGFHIIALNSITVIAISVNPVSQEGYSLDSYKLCHLLNERIGLPIIDVVSSIGVGL